MRIGIDARELTGHVTGVGRFLAGLLREWSGSSVAGQHEFVLYSPGPIAFALDARQFHMRILGGTAGTWWEQTRLPKAIARDALDVFFAPAYTAPLRITVPVVVLVHDVSYIAHPEWFRLRDGLRRRWLTGRTAHNARSIITPSEFSRGEIVDRLAIPASRVHAIAPGIDRLNVVPPRGQDPRVLYVGSLLNRRHVPDLIRAVGLLARTRPGVSLDIVGDDRTFPREDLGAIIANLGLGDRVRWHRYATNDHVVDLYSRARAFAFLSEYEGLGMTPLEALGAGVPPVLYDTPVARETCAGAALYVPVGDEAAVVRGLDRTLFDDTTRTSILSAAPATLAKYDWPRAARQTLAVFESAASSG